MKQNQWTALGLIGTAVLFSLSLWFSATVIGPNLKLVWGLTPTTEAWLSASVPLGFVIGALISAYFGLPDRFNTRKLFAISAFIGAILNLLLIFVNIASIGILIRVLTGLTLAGVYPPAVKLIAQWFPKQRGLATGTLIAALTLGSSLPHLISLIVVVEEAFLVLFISSTLALISAFIVGMVLVDAPTPSTKTHFSMKTMKRVLNNKPVMLANYGYFGHMWELYAMWTWLPAFLTASFLTYSSSLDLGLSVFVSFLAIGIAGGLGSIIGGILADKIGRSNLTIISLSVSSVCALLIGFTFGSNIWLTITLALIWGFFVIADSAQFSVAVSEFAEVEYLGTALTFQMCIGFLITIITINLIPWLQMWVGWEWAFVVLSIGPILGIVAMVKFKVYEKTQESQLDYSGYSS
ncbi:MFS transporter [Salipaludibacillus neizhouensis]|uniref:MFS transporter n=1 Tax=Salipaludibacillus neizhouensis TaxID=885475 RepID=A0A3A9JWT6_9BACI|nr:MFS transporter [Salipaludibacillus neizhouensis]RKL64729.1 MFS transporter [Salipaludibacillus neizhouensis]